MQLIAPRFCGQQLVSFALAIADILDLKAVTIDDSNTDGKIAFGSGDIGPATFIFEAQDGSAFECQAAPGAELGVKLAARWIASQLSAKRQQAAAAAPPEAISRNLQTREALMLMDRLRNEVGGYKARFKDVYSPDHDANIAAEILFNDGSMIQFSLPATYPVTSEMIASYIEDVRRAKANRDIPDRTANEKQEPKG